MEEVYAPQEDSFLLMSCIIKEDLKGKRCLDMGCGSGVQSEAMARSGAADITAADVNEGALKATEERLGKLGKKVFLVKSDLFSNVSGLFDFVAFNPPYVPSDKIKWRDLDGGKDGREVIDRFIEDLPARLVPGGACLLLISSLNMEEEVKKRLEKKGFLVVVCAWKKLFFETLFVMRAVKPMP